MELLVIYQQKTKIEEKKKIVKYLLFTFFKNDEFVKNEWRKQEFR